MAKDQYEIKAEEYRRQARELESPTSAPASLTDKVKQKVEDIQASKRSESAPTTRTEIGKTFKRGGAVSSASSRADGVAQRGKTKGRML